MTCVYITNDEPCGKPAQVRANFAVCEQHRAITYNRQAGNDLAKAAYDYFEQCPEAPVEDGFVYILAFAKLELFS